MNMLIPSIGSEIILISDYDIEITKDFIGMNQSFMKRYYDIETDHWYYRDKWRKAIPTLPSFFTIKAGDILEPTKIYIRNGGWNSNDYISFKYAKGYDGKKSMGNCRLSLLVGQCNEMDIRMGKDWPVRDK